MTSTAARLLRERLAADPRHYATTDGRVMPVSGTHTKGEECATCQTVPVVALARTVPLGALVTWPYGRRGLAHGRVLEQGRTRVRVWWHRSGKRGRDFWISAARLTRLDTALRVTSGCHECEAGR